MLVREVMSGNPATLTPDRPVREAARLMEEHDCGCIPVEDPGSHRLLGVVTDRDITVRVVGAERAPDTPVGEAMSTDPSCCRADDDVHQVERIMAERQVRRVPVIDQNGRCVGIVSMADLARVAEEEGEVDDRELALVVECISEPNGESRREVEVGERPSHRR